MKILDGAKEGVLGMSIAWTCKVCGKSNIYEWICRCQRLKAPIESLIKQMREIVKDYLKKHNLKFCGDEHQGIKDDEFCGVPQFDNNKVFATSQRSWGRLMAEVWGGDYLDFARKSS